MNLSSEIEEFSVHVCKRGSTFKKKSVRILSISSVPIIQIVSSRRQCVEDVDISSAAGIFISFGSGNSEKILKLLLKERKIALKFSDANSFLVCKETFDQLFGKVQKRKEYRNPFSDIRRISSGFQTLSYPLSRNSEYMNDMFETLSIASNSFSNEDYDCEDQTYVTMEMAVDSNQSQGENANIGSRKSDVSLYEDFFAHNYEVPEYSCQVKPLLGGYERLEKFNGIQTNNMNAYMFLAMKIREEISNSGGVKVELSDEFIHRFKVKLIDNKLWVSSIEWVDGKLHVGDRIITANGRPVIDVFNFQEICKNRPVSLIIQRLPRAKVFAYDMNNMNRPGIKLKKKDLSFSIRGKLKNEIWPITAINLETTTLNINSGGKVKVQSTSSLKQSVMTFVIHPVEFVNELCKS